MDNARPEPLVPADVDLRGMPGFMLNVERLLASELVALCTPEEGFSALMLWCRSWQQSPPASLPNDDRVLARFSGAGNRWPKVKEMALHGFVLCSDGRLYHPVLAAEAMKAFDKRLKYQGDQERLKRWRAERGVSNPKWEEIRARVFERDGWKCTKCGSPDDLHCDHVVSLGDGGTSDEANLTTLCRTCHGKKTSTSDIRSKSRRTQSEMHFTGSSEPEETETGTGTVKPETKVSGQSARKRSRFPDDWKPDEQDLAFARSRGMSEQRALDEAMRCREFHIAKGNLFADRHAAYRTWVMKAADFASASGGPNGRSPTPAASSSIVSDYRGPDAPAPKIHRSEGQPGHGVHDG